MVCRKKQQGQIRCLSRNSLKVRALLCMGAKFFAKRSTSLQEGAMKAPGDQELAGRQLKKRRNSKKQILSLGPVVLRRYY